MKPPPSDSAAPTGTYLVERYLTAAAAETLPAAVARVAGACASALDHVRYLHSTYLPSEDTCFCVFEADSAEAVREVNATADFAVDRITDARVMFDAPPTASSAMQDQRGDTP